VLDFGNKVVGKQESQVIEFVCPEMWIGKGVLIPINRNDRNDLLSCLLDSVHVRVVLLEVLTDLIHVLEVMPAGIVFSARAWFQLLVDCLIGRQLDSCLSFVLVGVLVVIGVLCVTPFL
jgi:hypothetical protein